jgi:PKD repeat protein
VGHDSVVQDSVDGGGGRWVYFGFREGQGVQGLQMEWLFNVTGLSPSNPPVEITGGNPQNGNLPQQTMQVGTITVGYWSYMYHCHPSGSNFYQGRGGTFWGNRFYRAGHSIFDVHRLRNVTPQIVVTGPATGYTGVPATFNANATNCSPAPGGWSWTATGGGQVVGGGTTASAQIQWSTTGSKTVSASNSGCPGATAVGAVIQILDPAPAIGGVSASPATAPICTPITFTGNNVTGQPPLTTNWTIEQGGDPVPGEGGPGNPFVWDTEGTSPGTYVGRLTVTGPGGSANAASPPVTLTALQPLPVSGYAITNDPPSFGTVQFHSAAATGATEWRWDFDGDPGGPNTFDLVTTDPVIGPNPVHDYTTVGTKHVWLEVRNCTTMVWVRSARLDVEITEVSPLAIITFAATCPFGQCSFQTNSPIAFNQQVIGNPDTYEYDWTNDGNDPFQVEQSSTNPIPTHTYTAPGAYRPILRVKRGAESVSFTHVATLNITTGGPPPPPPPPPPGPGVLINGPLSLNIGQEGNFTASASNCTPNPNGWNWNTAGGTGDSDTNAITLSWTSTGPKTINVSNTGCGSVVDSHTVNVTEPGGGSPVQAAFTVDPENPDAGQQVTFNAGTSVGAPTGFAWDFGDGTIGSGEEVTHTFAQTGVYEVGLTVSKVVPGSGCGSFGQEICTDNATVDVTVGDGGGACVPSATTVCLLGGRFEVTAHWHNHRNGDTGLARVYTPFSGDRTGMFWFFSADNVELIVKSLDATNPEVFPNPAFWFFYGGLSDVEYWVNVVDTVTDEEKEYHNEPDTICGVPDTGAFPMEPQTEEPEPVVTGGTALGAAGAFGADDATFDPSVITGAGSSGTCTPNGSNLCLLDGRFSVEVDWHDHHNNNDGVGHPILGTDRTGYFWFFNSDNVELVAKFINGTSVNGHYWLLWGGLSDVQYTIRVTDTVTGTQKQWENPPGSFCGGAAANAFPED